MNYVIQTVSDRRYHIFEKQEMNYSIVISLP